MDINYFVCTLGYAASENISTPYQNVNHLIDQQALNHADSPAVGFYIPEEKQKTFRTRILTFKEVLNGVTFVADTIEKKLKIESGQTVGLLSNSSPAFLFTWLGLIRLGHPVLLVAPQCSASAIAYLCKACNATILFHDDTHEKLAHDAVGYSASIEFQPLTVKLLPFEDDDEIFQLVHNTSKIDRKWPKIADTDIAYLHHTSGTSTGIPKSIPQTHRGAVCVLPALNGTNAATFSTTPLYHGGVADLFRAWVSAALIWLFPSSHTPITAANIVKCLHASSNQYESGFPPAIRYFSSVPYVLQMMAEDEDGLKYLQKMDIVGVGGAALPPEVGDNLVCNNVNLVSRYGSAECGFLMSSYRDFSNDKEWQYLRQPDQVKHLSFEKHEDGQSELVVLQGWPHMAKTNREDESFATSDLFAPHPTIPKAWKYHSRADSQLTLVTGKKFDPAPLEGALAAASPLLSEVLIFGTGKPYPGALLFRSEIGKLKLDIDIIQEVAPVVEKLNKETQSHARIPRNMLVPMPCEPSPLEKSSKGTILRGAAEDKFHDQIENAYGKTAFMNTDIEDEELPSAISRIIASVVGDNRQDDSDLTIDTDLFAYGVDSVASIQIRHALSQLLPKDTETLPLTIVQDSGTIPELAQMIMRYRKGHQVLNKHNDSQLLQHLVRQYSSFARPPSPVITHAKPVLGYTVLLTGPTGLLGVHILSQLLSHPQVKKVYLLVRGATKHAARERVLKSLKSRMLSIPTNFDKCTDILPCKLSEPNLGLSTTDYQLLTSEVDKIFHLAWSVNFLVSLRSLATTHLSGLQNLLNLALACDRKPQFLFCSSIASVSNHNINGSIPESIVDDVSACGPTGYAQSKLAAELICTNCANTTHLRNRITVVRVGQLSGDTKAGVWNASEAYPLMLSSSRATGVLPDLKHEVLGWLPVDIAATAYTEAAFGAPSTAVSRTEDDTSDRAAASGVQVLHLINTSRATTFTDLTKCIQEFGEDVTVVSVKEWLTALEGLQEKDETKTHLSLRLLSFWKQTYGSDSVEHGKDRDVPSTNEIMDGARECNRYETALSEEVMPVLKDANGPLSRDYMLKLWRWVKESVN